MAQPDWPQVRAHLRRVRRAHARRSLRARAADAYQALLYTVVIGGVVTAAAGRLAGGLVPPSEGARYWLGIAAALLELAALVRGLPMLGPVTVAPAAATWLLPAPLDRAGFLAGRFAAAVGATVLAGSAVGAQAWAVGIAPGPAGGGALVVAGGAAGGLAAAVAVLLQTRADRERLLARAALVLAAPAVIGAGAVVLLERAGAPPPRPVVGDAVPITAAALGIGVAAVAVSRARRSLGRLDRRAVTAAGPVLAALTSSVGFMDGAVLLGVARERRLQAAGPVRSGRIRAGRLRALLVADTRRMRRSGPAWGLAAALLVVPYLATVVLPAQLVPVVQLLGATVATSGLAAGLRAVAASPGLRRSLGGSDRALLAVHAVGPAVVAASWTALAAAAGGTVVSLALVPVSALLVVLRSATRPPRNDAATLVDLGFGPIPVETIVGLLRGPVLFAALAAVQLVVSGW